MKLIRSPQVNIELITAKLNLSYLFGSRPIEKLLEKHHECVAALNTLIAKTNPIFGDVASNPSIIVSSSYANTKGSIDNCLSRSVVVSVLFFSIDSRLL